MIFSHLEVVVLGKVLILIVICPVQIIIVPDVRAIFPAAAAILVYRRWTAIWRLHTRLSNFARNILTNISALGQCAHRKIEKMSLLFIFYKITISLLNPQNDFWFFIARRWKLFIIVVLLWQQTNQWVVVLFVDLWQIFLEYLDVSFNKITTLDGLKVCNVFTVNAAD